MRHSPSKESLLLNNSVIKYVFFWVSKSVIYKIIIDYMGTIQCYVLSIFSILKGNILLGEKDKHRHSYNIHCLPLPIIKICTNDIE